jgi:OmpA-OmpF porin, OOP family
MLVVASGSVLAQAGPYLGGALGQSKLKEWCTGGGTAACESTDTGWKLLGGYRFNRYLAAEASYIDWGEVTATVRSATQTVGVKASQHSYGLVAVGTLPIGERFELFGKAGLLRTEQEATSTRTVKRDDTEFHYGAGVKYAFTRNWAVRGEWEKTDKLKVELLSIGVEYRF